MPGVPGIGVKTAAQLINDYGDLDALLARAEEIKQPKRRQNLIEHAEMARVSRELVTLRRDAPLPMPLEALVRKQPEPGALRAFFLENGFRSIAARLDGDDGETRLAEEEAEPEEAAPLPTAYPLVTDASNARGLGRRRRGRAACSRWSRSGRPGRRRAPGSPASRLPRRRGRLVTSPSATPARTLLGAEEAVPQLGLADALAVLDPLLRDPGVLKLALDIKQTVRLLAKHGARLAPVDDPMLGLLGARRQPAQPRARGPHAHSPRPRGAGAGRPARQRAQQGLRRRARARGAAGYGSGARPILRSACTGSSGRASSPTASPRCTSGSSGR